MKKKDIVYLILAVVILFAAGYIAYAKLLTHGSSQSGVQVDVVGTIQSSFSQDDLDTLADPTKVLDFYQPVDLTTGLNNTAPFGH